MVRVFANDPGNWSEIKVERFQKHKKKKNGMRGHLNTQHYKVRIKGKWNNPGKEVAPASIPQYCSYLKGSLWCTLYYGRQTWLI